MFGVEFARISGTSGESNVLDWRAFQTSFFKAAVVISLVAQSVILVPLAEDAATTVIAEDAATTTREPETAYKNTIRSLPKTPRPFQTPIMRRILFGISLVGKMGNDKKIELTKDGMDLHLDGFMVDAP